MTGGGNDCKRSVVKVLFDHPNPFSLAHGGFQVQIEQTKLALEKTGCEVEWLRWWEAEQKGDVVHYFGRPHPTYIQQSQQMGLKVVMTELLTGLGSRTAFGRFIQRWMIKGARGSLPHDFTARMGWDSYRLAHRVIALTAWEKQLMEEQFSAPEGRVVVVPNGVEEVFLRSFGKTPRGTHLVTTMTITERKRSVELAQAAALAKVKLRIIGSPYHPQDPYHLRFLAALREAGPWVEYAGGISDRAQLAGEYRRAGGFVLLSGMESQSLSALEAAACGCPLLLSDLPWAKVSFADQASYAPLASPERTAPHLRKFAAELDKAPRTTRIMGWHEVAGRLREVYREAMTSR